MILTLRTLLGARLGRAAISALGAIALTAGGPAVAQPGDHKDGDAPHKPPVLVELFTSQGCSSCPKANAFLGQLGQEPGMITLTYAVGYWDYLGWRDTFAKAEFTDRQKSYAARFKHGVYTPQMVVDGATHSSGLKPKELRTLLETAAMPGGLKMHGERAPDAADKAKFGVFGNAPSDPADIWVAQFVPGPIYVDVKHGENAGAKVPHYNVVTKLTKIGQFTGGPKHLVVDCQPACAMIVQSADGGAVLAARMVSAQGVAPAAGTGPAVVGN